MAENYAMLTTWGSKEKTYNMAVECKPYKIYGFEYDFEDLIKIETLVQNNCIEKFGDVLFDTITLSRRIHQDAQKENNEEYAYGVFARWIAITFMQALVEDKISDELRNLINDYIFNNKKHYDAKLDDWTMFGEMYNACKCYPEMLFWKILQSGRSDIIGDPLFLYYGKTLYCKVRYSKPNTDGTGLELCDKEESEKAAGFYRTPEEIEKDQKLLHKLFEFIDEKEKEGLSDEELKKAIKDYENELSFFIF